MYAAFSSDPDGKLTFELIGNEVRGEAFGGELCGPYLKIDRMGMKSLVEMEISWRESEVNFLNRTYFTLHGEGFSLISGTLKLVRKGSDGIEVRFDGETDYPPHDAPRGIRIRALATPSESTPKPW